MPWDAAMATSWALSSGVTRMMMIEVAGVSRMGLGPVMVDGPGWKVNAPEGARRLPGVECYPAIRRVGTWYLPKADTLGCCCVGCCRALRGASERGVGVSGVTRCDSSENPASACVLDDGCCVVHAVEYIHAG